MNRIYRPYGVGITNYVQAECVGEKIIMTEIWGEKLGVCRGLGMLLSILWGVEVIRRFLIGVISIISMNENL
jgi:hypothetical protein